MHWKAQIKEFFKFYDYEYIDITVTQRPRRAIPILLRDVGHMVSACAFHTCKLLQHPSSWDFCRLQRVFLRNARTVLCTTINSADEDPVWNPISTLPLYRDSMKAEPFISTLKYGLFTLWEKIVYRISGCCSFISYVQSTTESQSLCWNLIYK